MNLSAIFSIVLLGILLGVRYMAFGYLSFLQNIVNINIFMIVLCLSVFTYSHYLSKKLQKDNVQDSISELFSDVNILTKISNDGVKRTDSFEKDKENDERNKEILRNTLLISFVPLFPLLYMLHKEDKKFWRNLKLNFMIIFILFVVQVYFNLVLLSEYRDRRTSMFKKDILEAIDNKI